MKKIGLILLLILSYCIAISQPITQRGSATITVVDARMGATYNMLMPRYLDTIAANLNLGIDSCGAIIYTYTQSAAWFRQCSPKKWVLFGSTNGNSNTDTIYTRIPIAVDTVTLPGKRILFLIHLNGLESGGIVTLDTCMTIDISAAVYYLGYKQINSNQLTGVVIPAADSTFTRIDAIIADSSGRVFDSSGIPSATPTAPQINPSSQILLTTITIPANATCLGVTAEIIYDQHTGSPEWTVTTSGTLSNDPDNLLNPYHLTKADLLSTYQNGAQIIYTKPSGVDTVQAGEILKFFLSVRGAFVNQIQGQWFNGSTPVSNSIVLNPYFNPNDSGNYQIVSPPMSAWNFTNTAGYPQFNKLAFTFAGNDVSGANGMFIDWIQLQTGIVNINTQLTLTTNGTSGAATYNNISHILNIPVYGGGSGGSQNLQQTTDVGNTTTRAIITNSLSVTGTGVLFNLDSAGKFSSNGYGSNILFNKATGDLGLQSTFAAGVTGGTPSYTSGTLYIKAAGNINLGNYGTGFFTGTPTHSLNVDASGNVIEGAVGGGGSSLANFYLKDSALSTPRTVDLNGNDLSFSDGGGTGFIMSPSGGSILFATPTGKQITVSDDDDKVDIKYNSSTEIVLGEGSNTITHTADTSIFNSVIKYITPPSGATTDSLLTINTNGVVNKINIASIGGGTVTEQQNFFNGEYSWNKGLNTSTGAITSDATKDLADYLPVPGSTSITISTTDSSDITIFGATYDSTLTYISNIRSSALIGTLLKTYTFTTPSNARYLSIYTKAAGDSFNVRLRVYGTNPITYNIPITPEQFSGTSATAKIQAAVNFARWTTSGVWLRGQYDLDSAIILSSGSTVILDNAKLQVKYAMQDNVFRNEAVAQVTSHIFARGNRNIKVIGLGKAVIQGSTNNWDLNTKPTRFELIHFANIESFEISGISLTSSLAWATLFEQCRIGIIKNITFGLGVALTNQDGIHVERGSHGLTIEDIKGTSSDDMIAINNLKINNADLFLPTIIYEPYRTNLDIYDISIRNIQHSGYQPQLAGAVSTWSSTRLICGDSLKVHDISIQGVYGIPEIQIQSSGSYFTTPPSVNDMYNIHVTDAFCGVYIYRAIKNSTFINVPPFDTTGVFPTVKPPNGSLNIIRKYQNDQQENIDSVVASVEYISVKTPMVVGGALANSTIKYKSTTGIGTTDAHIFLVGNNGATEAMRIASTGYVGIGTTSPNSPLEIQSGVTNDGLRINAQTTGNPTIVFQRDAGINGYLGATRTNDQFASGTLAGDMVLRANSSNIDFVATAVGLAWKISTAGHLLPLASGTAPNTLDIGATATRVRNIWIDSSIVNAGSMSVGYIAKAANYTATARDYTIECTSATFTVTLPTAVGIGGRMYVITNSGAGVITVATTSSQTFVNVLTTPTTLTLSQFNTVTVQSNGTNWLRLTNL